MEGTENEHIVDFHKYCPECQYRDFDEENDPCWDCLAVGVTLNGVPDRYKLRSDIRNFYTPLNERG